MGAAEVAHAYLSITPTLKGAAASITSQLSKVDLSRVGERIGGQLADGIDGTEASVKAKAAGKKAGDGFERGIEDGLDGVESTFSTKMAAVSGAVGGMVSSLVSSAINSIAALGGEMVAASDSANKFASTLSFAGMDTAQIDKLTQSTQAYADATVYDLGDIRNVTAQLASNGVKDFDKLAEAAGNLNAVAGGNAETFSSVGMVMTQTAGAGKLTTENWNQLADAIPGASGALQEALKTAGAFKGNFRDAMADGEISAEEFFAAVQKLGMEDVAAKAATSTETIEGAMGNLQASVVGVGSQVLDEIKPVATDAITAVANAVSSAGEKIGPLLDAAKPVLEDLVEAVQTTIEKIGPLLEAAKPFLDGFVEAVKGAAIFVRTHLGQILPIIGAVVGGFVAFKVALVITGAITAVQTALAALPPVLTLVKTGVQMLNTAFRANPFAVVATVIGVVVGALVTLWTTNEGFRNAVLGIWAGIKSAFSSAIGSIKGVIDGAKGFINGFGEKFKEIKRTISSAINGAKENVQKAVDKIKSFFDVTLKFNGIKLPHITVSWNTEGALGSIAEKLGLPGVPDFDVSWYARGGIIDGASIIGVGEAGPEAVVPLTAPALLPFAHAVASQIGDGAAASTVYNMTVNGLSFNDNEAVRAAFVEILREFIRKGGM